MSGGAELSIQLVGEAGENAGGGSNGALCLKKGPSNDAGGEKAAAGKDENGLLEAGRSRKEGRENVLGVRSRSRSIKNGGKSWATVAGKGKGVFEGQEFVEKKVRSRPYSELRRMEQMEEEGQIRLEIIAEGKDGSKYVLSYQDFMEVVFDVLKIPYGDLVRFNRGDGGGRIIRLKGGGRASEMNGNYEF